MERRNNARRSLGATAYVRLRRLQTPLALASSDFRCERVQSLRPGATQAIEPRVDLRERRAGELVDATLPVYAGAREVRVAKHAQVLRHSRLRDVELTLNRLDNLAGCPRLLGQQLEDAAPNGIAEDVERLHYGAASGAGSPV